MLKAKSFGRLAGRLGVVAVVAIGLVACGGGGGGGPPAPTAQIAATNFAEIGADSMQAALNMFGAGEDGFALLGTGQSAQPAKFNIVDFSRQQLQRVQQRSGDGAFTAAATVIQDCDNFGVGTIVATDSPNSVVVTFNNCVLLGVTFNGSLTISNISASLAPDNSSGSLSATFSYNNFVVMDGVDTVSFNGSFSFFFSFDDITPTLTISLTVGSFTIVENGVTTTYARFTVSETITDSGFSFTVNGTITNSSFGTVAIATTTPFSGTGTVPTSGSMTITGANGSRLVLTVLGPTGIDDSSVRLQVFDGTTLVDETTTTWSALTA